MADLITGLTRDDETLHDGRIRLWDEFNQAWLVTLQRQLDLTQESMQTSQPPSNGQSLMTAGILERLSQELVRLCDLVERHGLVDYQMGVAEEEIMDRESLSSIVYKEDRSDKSSSSLALSLLTQWNER